MANLGIILLSVWVRGITDGWTLMVGLGININAEGEGKMVIYTEHPIGDRSPSKIFHKSASIMSVCYKGSGGVVFSS